MVKRFKSFAAVFVTVLTLCAFAMPMICTPAHAHDQMDSVSGHDGMSITDKSDNNTKDQKQHEPGKSADNCCVSHHCCSAKLITPAEQSSFIVSVVSLKTFPYVNQVITGFDIHGLERPPKNLV